MKRLALIFIFLLFAVVLKAQETQIKTGSVIEFEDKIFDFGVITQGHTVEHTFVFRNTGTEPLRITSARGSCGCTVPKYSKQEVAPSDKREVFVCW